ncbi:MAG: hypothetical protein JXA60_05800 [Candidatus Coatesbacteria bacterium]|nr:hypothetical protein [Candidatus Coatesbacteria bacterium]
MKKLFVLVVIMSLFMGFACDDEEENGNNTGTGTSTGTGTGTGTGGSAIIIDHNCTDITKIPANIINTIKTTLKHHYAHTSHGGQLTVGLERLEQQNATYDIEIGYSYLPDNPAAYCIFDGQEDETYISPDLYWETKEGMDRTRNVLRNNPAIKASMWCWCCQLDSYNQEQVQAYLDSMSSLEREFPNVKFVYMTGNAQAQGDEGYNRYQRNNQIRDYCNRNGKILYDFEDLDCWWYNPSSKSWEHSTYDHSSQAVPYQHTHFDGDENAHTTNESCEQKGKATWWLAAKLVGW